MYQDSMRIVNDENRTYTHKTVVAELPNIFYLYTLYIEHHIKTYNNIQYTNGIQKKGSRRIRICIPFKISI